MSIRINKAAENKCIRYLLSMLSIKRITKKAIKIPVKSTAQIGTYGEPIIKNNAKKVTGTHIFKFILPLSNTEKTIFAYRYPSISLSSYTSMIVSLRRCASSLISGKSNNARYGLDSTVKTGLIFLSFIRSYKNFP